MMDYNMPACIDRLAMVAEYMGLKTYMGYQNVTLQIAAVRATRTGR